MPACEEAGVEGAYRINVFAGVCVTCVLCACVLTWLAIAGEMVEDADDLKKEDADVNDKKLLKEVLCAADVLCVMRHVTRVRRPRSCVSLQARCPTLASTRGVRCVCIVIVCTRVWVRVVTRDRVCVCVHVRSRAIAHARRRMSTASGRRRQPVAATSPAAWRGPRTRNTSCRCVWRRAMCECLLTMCHHFCRSARRPTCA
jgi:hypothetical protein